MQEVNQESLLFLAFSFIVHFFRKSLHETSIRITSMKIWFHMAPHGFSLEAILRALPNMCAICTSFRPHRSNDSANERAKLTLKGGYSMYL